MTLQIGIALALYASAFISWFTAGSKGGPLVFLTVAIPSFSAMLLLAQAIT